MLKVQLPEREYFNDREGVFYKLEGKTLEFEHSLRSLYDWEAEWRTPFLATKEFTPDQMRSYIKHMCLSEIDDSDINRLGQAEYDLISEYIEAPMSATTFPETNERPSREKITAEIVYHWMFSAQIPLECENWHLNRLFTLIRVISIKNNPPKKMSSAEIAQRNRALNEQRRQQLGTKG